MNNSINEVTSDKSSMNNALQSSDVIIKGLLFGGAVDVTAISGRSLVEKARQTHKLSRVCTAALGRSLLGTSLMASALKNDTDSITMIIAGGGPAGKITAVGTAGGIVKGYIENSQIELPLTEKNKLDVSGAVGKNGEIRVIRDLSLKEPYVGRCPLATGEIAEDLAKYFFISEQQPSLVYLGVHIEPVSGKTLAASGMIISPLPNCPDEYITRLEVLSGRIAMLTGILEKNASLESALKDMFADMDFEILAKMTPAFECDCSRFRLEKVLISLGADELKSIIETDGQAEVVCRFCSKKYHFDKEELISLFNEASDKSESEAEDGPEDESVPCSDNPGEKNGGSENNAEK